MAPIVRYGAEAGDAFGRGATGEILKDGGVAVEREHFAVLPGAAGGLKHGTAVAGADVEDPLAGLDAGQFREGCEEEVAEA